MNPIIIMPILNFRKSKNCKRCGIPADWFNIAHLKKDGTCKLCDVYEKNKDILCNFEKKREIFEKAINENKGKFKYDVAVGFSGGKDSSYICHTLKSKYGCRLLAVTANFGFMPSGPAIDNMKRITEKLGIDHVFVDFTSEEIRKAFAFSIKKNLDLCKFCSNLCWDAVRKVSIEKQIPCYIMGSDRGQLLRDMDESHIEEFLKNEKEKDAYGALLRKNLIGLSDSDKSIKDKREYYQERGISKKTAEKIFPAMKILPGTDSPSLLIHYFLFHPYDEKKMKKILAEETGWVLPKGDHLHSHHDCLLHDAAQLTILKINGETLTAGEISVDSREGTITRKEAVGVIERERENLINLKDPYKVFEEFFRLKGDEVQKAIIRKRNENDARLAKKKMKMIFNSNSTWDINKKLLSYVSKYYNLNLKK